MTPRLSVAAGIARKYAATNHNNNTPTVLSCRSRFSPPSVLDAVASAVDHRIEEDISEIGNSSRSRSNTLPPATHPTKDNVTNSEITFVSYNAQKSAFNTSVLLESYKQVDIILIQECYWGPIKKVPSPLSPSGVTYNNTISHPQFLCLGAQENSRVVTYVNKNLAHLKPSICSNEIHHRDLLLIQLNFDGNIFRVLNIYNDCRTHEASQYLVERSISLPPIQIISGDFNLRH